MKRKPKKADLAWAKAKVEAITHDPELLLLVMLTQAEFSRYDGMTVDEIYKAMKEDPDRTA